jgi:hypothetical protein
MTRPSLAIALALLASACAHKSRAAQKTSEAQVAEPKEEVVCFKERPTGTQIVQRICYPKADFDTQVAAAQDQFRRMLQAGSQNRGGPPQVAKPATTGK